VSLPGAKRGDDGSRKSKTEVLTLQVRFSSTGREWAAISGEGLLVYSLDEDMIFDPISLTEAITPAAIFSKLATGNHGLALRMAIHLNEFGLVKQVLDETPYDAIPQVVRSMSAGTAELERLIQCVANVTLESPHIEFYLHWSLQILQVHGMHMDRDRGSFMRAFRALYKAVLTRQNELKNICNENKYMLCVLEDHVRLGLESKPKLAELCQD
jgi:periodic tryptophan protein 2